MVVVAPYTWNVSKARVRRVVYRQEMSCFSCGHKSKESKGGGGAVRQPIVRLCARFNECNDLVIQTNICCAAAARTANPDLPISYFLSQSSVKTHFNVIYSRNSFVLEVFQHYLFTFLDTHCFLMVSQSADNFMMGFYIKGVILMEII